MKKGLKLEHIKGAVLRGRNIAAFFVTWFLLDRIPFPESWRFYNENTEPYIWLAGAFLVYSAFVVQSLASPKFRAKSEKRALIGKIRKMSNECYSQARSMKRKLSVSDQKRLAQVISDTEEVVNSFFNSDKNYLKVRVVEKTLSLASLYTKMFSMYQTRQRVLDGGQISQVARRINANTSYLNSIRDSMTKDEIMKVIANDEKYIESLKNEKIELEKLSARLQYMESTISMLKYNIVSNLVTEDVLGTLESEVNEADALNEVLSGRFEEKRSRERILN
ncbi:MAG: hypothetical protein FWH55_07175 [Oscillospiraceae bacterium]|nr:hypothetical protein [Oscillospiraceae bacterium]